MARSVNEEPYCPGWAANAGAIPLKLNIRGILLSTMEINWHDYFIADFEAGTLKWKERPIHHFTDDGHRKMWNARYAGNDAGYFDARGYRRVKLFRKRHYAHRIIFEMDRGPIPEGLQVDHIDQNKSNNRLDNLRLATNAENQHNRRRNSANRSGVKGVSWSSARQKYYAHLVVNGKSVLHHSFSSLDEAAKAHAEACRLHQGEFAYQA